MSMISKDTFDRIMNQIPRRPSPVRSGKRVLFFAGRGSQAEDYVKRARYVPSPLARIDYGVKNRDWFILWDQDHMRGHGHGTCEVHFVGAWWTRSAEDIAYVREMASICQYEVIYHE